MFYKFVFLQILQILQEYRHGISNAYFPLISILNSCQYESKVSTPQFVDFI